MSRLATRRLGALVLFAAYVTLTAWAAVDEPDLGPAIAALIGGAVGVGVGVLAHIVGSWKHPAVAIPLVFSHIFTFPIRYEGSVSAVWLFGLVALDMMFLATALVFQEDVMK